MTSVTSILDQIVAAKRVEIAQLHRDHDVDALREQATARPSRFPSLIRQANAHGHSFLIAEFKRRSPSAGLINEQVSVRDQVATYREAGAHAVSVLTDGPHFGGSYDDLKAARDVLNGTDILLLQKDFILDEIQLLLARASGADLILLIAAILSEGELSHLYTLARSYGLDVLVEVKSRHDLDKIHTLTPPVVGINHRDLDTFRIALGRSSTLRQSLPTDTLVIAESGIESSLDLAIAQHNTDGLLVGTSLMRNPGLLAELTAPRRKRYFYKACGIRTREFMAPETADLIGINFSPESKRQVPEALLASPLPPNAVGVFYRNIFDEVLQRIASLKLRYVQVYADDFSPAQVATLPCRVLLGLRSDIADPVATAAQYAQHVDAFILDGPRPGSGEAGTIPSDFPYPFILGGGVNASNLDRLHQYPQCIGADIASGIEVDGQVSDSKLQYLRQQIASL
jgi:indole-3-glycerol phosphate synthase